MKIYACIPAVGAAAVVFVKGVFGVDERNNIPLIVYFDDLG